MKDRLSTLRKKASLGNKELPQLTPPNYNNDAKLSPIYNQFESINRKIAAVNKKLDEIQDLVEKEHKYTNNADIYRSKNLVSKHLNIASVMMEEITKDIKNWRSKANPIHSKPVKTAQDLIELAFYESSINSICNCLGNYITAKNFIDEKYKSDLRRYLKISNIEVDEERIEYLVAHPQEIDTNAFSAKMSNGVNEEISKLEMASVEILNGMKSIQGMTALLELILQQQSKKIRNIEDQVANTLREVETSNRSLKVAQHYQL